MPNGGGSGSLSGSDVEQGTTQAEGKGRDRRRLLLLGAGGAAGLVILCICVVVGAVLALRSGGDGGDGTVAAQEAPVTVAAAVEEPAATEPPLPPATAAASATGTPAPSGMPESTNTPQPTETVASTSSEMYEFGTYLVGVEILPGLYYGERQGGAGPCFIERLSDLSGDPSAVIGQFFGVTQYYVEVFETDYALNIGCPSLTLLRALPEPLEQFPTTLFSGDYLVGITMQPGIYSGEGMGPESGPACYWARLSGFSGEAGDILASGSETGPFTVEVQPGDFGFSLDCSSVLTLVE